MEEKSNVGILITGATGGIGEEVAKMLSQKGVPVVLVARNEEKLRQLQGILPGESYIFSYDLRNLNDISQIFDFCLSSGIKLNGLVHCAGVNNDHAIKHNDDDLMKQCFEINYMSFVDLLKMFVKKKYSVDGSSVVALSSYSTFNVVPGQGIYASSKSALEATVKIAAKESLNRKIRINAIAPNYVRTEMVSNTLFCDFDEINNKLPLGIIEPEYIAYLIEFLLSDRAKYITGAVIPVSAGSL